MSNLEVVLGKDVFPGIESVANKRLLRPKERSALVPASNPNYKPNPELVRKALAWWYMRTRNLSFSLFGETGTGKTEFWAYMCDMLNWPMVVVSVSETLRPESVKSGLAMRNGETVHELSAAAKAAEIGALLVLDEMDKGSLDFLAALHPLMEYKGLPLEKQGRVIKPHPLFRLVGTCQTNGCGDSTGRYQSCQPLDEAVRRRFMWAQASYPDAVTEEAILTSEAPLLPNNIRRQMCRVAAKARLAMLSEDGEEIGGSQQTVQSALSTRIMVEWARFLIDLGPEATPKEAFETVFLSSTEYEDRRVYETLCQAVLGSAWDKPMPLQDSKAA